MFLNCNASINNSYVIFIRYRTCHGIKNTHFD